MKVDVYSLLPDSVKETIGNEISEALSKNNYDVSLVTWDILCELPDEIQINKAQLILGFFLSTFLFITFLIMELSYSDYWEYYQFIVDDIYLSGQGYIYPSEAEKQAMDHMNKCGYRIKPS